jgi:hypothetical protein
MRIRLGNLNRAGRWADGAIRHGYLMNAWLAFEPWIIVWQVTQGVTVVEPGSKPWTPPAESGLWH